MPAIDSGHKSDARIIDVLRRADEPLDTAAVAERLGQHPTGVRRRLQQLEVRGLVRGEKAHGAVGRPAILWSVTPRAVAEAELPHTGWSIARSLARAIPPNSERLEEVEDAGYEMGLSLVDKIGSVSAGEDPILSALDALGFAPESEQEGQRRRYTLQSCPYAEAVRENPQVVCTLHKGMIAGLLSKLEPDAELTGFDAKPPDIAGCTVDVIAPDGEVKR